MEELGIPPLVAGRDLINDFSPGPSEERKEPPLPKQNKWPICKEKLLGGELIPEHLWSQVDGPHQESPTVRSQLVGSDTEVYQHILGERVQRHTKVHQQCVLVKRQKPKLMAVGLPRRDHQGKVTR